MLEEGEDLLLKENSSAFVEEADICPAHFFLDGKLGAEPVLRLPVIQPAKSQPTKLGSWRTGNTHGQIEEGFKFFFEENGYLDNPCPARLRVNHGLPATVNFRVDKLLQPNTSSGIRKNNPPQQPAVDGIAWREDACPKMFAEAGANAWRVENLVGK